MKKQIIALGTAILMLSGCTSTQSDGSTERNKAIMATIGETKVAYGDFLHYIDITEEMARLIAQENMAFSEMIKKDLAASEAGFDQEAFDGILEEMAGGELDQIMGMEEMTATVDMVSQKAGMTIEEYREAAKMDYAPTMLMDMMNEQIYFSSGEDEEDYYAALEEYTDGFEDRTDFTNKAVLVKLDGEELPLTENLSNYFNYAGLMARANAIHTIALNKVIHDEMIAEGMTVDQAGYPAHREEVLGIVTSDEVYQLLLPRALENLALSEDAYNQALDAYLYLSYSSQYVEETLNGLYEKLPEDSRPKTIEDYKNDYYAQRSQDLIINEIKP